MAIILFNADGAGGTDGDALSVANTGGGGNTACETPTSPGALIFSSAAAAHGSLGIRVVPSSGVIREGRWNWPAAEVMQFRGYFTRRANPTAAHTILQIKSGSTTLVQFAFSSSNPGRLNTQNAAGAPLFGDATSNTIIDQLMRLEFKIDSNTGTGDGVIDVALYQGESTTPQATFSSTTANLGGPLDSDNLRIGRPSGTTTDVTTEDWDSFVVWTGADIPATLNNPFPGVPPEKIDFTAVKSGADEVTISWLDPGDAPNGVAILRGPGNLKGVADTNGRFEADPLFDFSTVAGVSVIASNQDAATDSPFVDDDGGAGLSPITYSYGMVRES